MSSCSLPEKVERPSLNISQISNCPKPPSEPPAIEVNERANNIYNAFNYQIVIRSKKQLQIQMRSPLRVWNTSLLGVGQIIAGL